MVEFYSLYWDNVPKPIVRWHQSVMRFFNIPINYTAKNVDHGAWLDDVCNGATSAFIGFLDIDCVPISLDKLNESIDWVKRHGTFLGNAQVSNHIAPFQHIYAAPSFFIISVEYWRSLNCSFRITEKADTGENITYEAEKLGSVFKILMPETWESKGKTGPWNLADLGKYGVGTTFEGTNYHLFESRMGGGARLFRRRCREIIKGSFDNKNHNSCTR